MRILNPNRVSDMTGGRGEEFGENLEAMRLRHSNRVEEAPETATRGNRRRPPKKVARAVAWSAEKSHRRRALEQLGFKSYEAYLRSDRWKKRRLDALRKVGGVCEHCDAIDKLEVHHKTYARLGNEQPSDLQVLCARCHAAEHRRINPPVYRAKLRAKRKPRL